MKAPTATGSGKGLPTTRRGRETRAAIVDAAAALMYEHGVHATSLDAVLSACGAGKSQLYHYFADKTDLVDAVINRQLDRIIANQPALNHLDSWMGIDTWIAQVLDAQSTPGGPFACPLAAIAAELRYDEALRPSLDAAFRKLQGHLVQGLTTMQRRGELSVDADPEGLASMMFAAMQGGTLLGWIHRDITPLQKSISAAMETLRSHAAVHSRMVTATDSGV